MRKLKYYVACTLDGFIAHLDGSFDGFCWDNEVVDDFIEDLKQFGTVLMGRKTYEVGLNEGKTSPYPEMRQILFSTSMTAQPDPAVELITENSVEVVRSLKVESESDIWLCGGSLLASSLMAENLIDEVIVKLNPIIFGSGIPLFTYVLSMIELEIVERKLYRNSGVMKIHYCVKKAA